MDRRARGLVAAALAVALAAATVTAARAQVDQPPGETLDEAVDSINENESVPDTDYTPKYKESPLWRQVGGALYPSGGASGDGTELVPASPTSFDVDLYGVRFLNARNGFAVGSACEEPPQRQDGESASAYGDRVEGCEGSQRVPVIYRFTNPPNGDPIWAEVYRGSSPGYAGAVAWMPSGKALVVGGTGTYTRREVERGPTEPYEDWVNRDPAGQGRAWLIDAAASGGSVHELNELPSGMRGMSALDFYPFNSRELGFAGALGQIWRWKDSQFDQVWDRSSRTSCGGNPSPCEPGTVPMARAPRFLYRVREIRFVRSERAQAFAVTAGCCGDATGANPRLLAYAEGRQNPEAGATTSWSVRSLSIAGHTGVVGFPFDAEPPGDPGQRPDVPDSLYSFLVTDISPPSFPSYDLSLLMSPGGPRSAGEPPSRISGRICLSEFGAVDPIHNGLDVPGDPVFEALRASLSTTRLLSADGDAGKSAPFGANSNQSTSPSTLSPQSISPGCQPPTAQGAGDGIPDWAVGERRATMLEGLGSRGIAYGTALRPAGVPINGDPVNDPTSFVPETAEKLTAYLRARAFALPSYTLNSLDVVGTTGQGWSVGDHGAIVRLSEAGGSGGGGASEEEPAPPRLGSKAPQALADDAPYDPFGGTPPDGPVPPVPGLAQQPLENLGEGRLEPAGSPDATHPAWLSVEDVRQIVMSRDGTEGWALGPHELADNPVYQPPQTSLFHYQNGAWSRCDPLGIGDLVPPDPACKELAPLRAYGSPRTNPPGRAGVQILAAARIPLENDADPANDDEFEVAAITSNYSERGEPERPAMLLYRDGRWGIVPHEQTQALDSLTSNFFMPRVGGLAFAGPGEGWLLSRGNELFRWNGSRWIACNNLIPANQTVPDPGQLDPACEDPAGRTLFEPGSDNDVSVGSDQTRGIFATGARVYVFGTRVVRTRPSSLSPTGSTVRYPMIIYRDQGRSWEADPDDTGLDPGFEKRGQAAQGTLTDSLVSQDTEQGQVGSLAVTRLADGRYAGWAFGFFAGRSVSGVLVGRDIPTRAMLRLEPGGAWTPFEDRGAVADTGFGRTGTLGDSVANPQNGPMISRARNLGPLVVPSAGGGSESFLVPPGGGARYAFNEGRERWELMRTGRPRSGLGPPGGTTQGVAPDGRGGFWLAMRTSNITDYYNRDSPVYLFHYTRTPPRPVFTEVANPFHRASERVTSLHGAPDGSLWAGTSAGAVAHYERHTGWERVAIPGWDPGPVVTRPSEVRAVAANAEGEGIAVGERGRIADLSPHAIRLDAAAGTLCGAEAGACGTGRDLGAAAVAPGGAALAGGDHLALLSRPPNGEFRAVTPPPAARSAAITGISMPEANRAWLTTDKGDVFVGTGGDSGWSWSQENLSASGELLSLDSLGNALALRAIAVDADGHGYAVGDRGLILERTGAGDAPWRRLVTPYLDNLTSVTLAAGGGGGALIGGLNGLILTASGRNVEVARQADFFNAFGGVEPERAQITGPTVGLALLPGVGAGQVEAWAAISGRNVSGAPANRLLHYTNAPAEPLLDPDHGIRPLSDAPAARPGELSFAAFGKSECGIPADLFCSPMTGATSVNEVSGQRIAEELRTSAGQSGGPAFAVWTGDAVDSAGAPGSDVSGRQTQTQYTSGPAGFRRWRELFADPISDSGLPLYGAVGSQDVSEVPVCDFDHCYTKGKLKSGDNLAWRQAMATQPGPWGAREPASESSGFTFEPVADSAGAKRSEDVPLSDPTGAGVVPGKVPLGGASTHYAFDVVRDGNAVARLVFLDNSLRSLAASDPGQQPLESGAGQTGWLDSMLCFEGQESTTGEPCTRKPGKGAVVVAEAPTYTYGPGALADTATDGATLEALLLRYRVSAVVSGRLGWNALYYLRNVAGAPADHSPPPGGGYPAGPPDPLPGQQGASLPFVIAAGAGGKFGPDGNATGSASEGYWHGYTIVRLGPGGDPSETIVEQRPLLDWISVSAPAHVVRASRKLTLSGVGREPIATADIGASEPVVRYDEISTPAITHLYTLLYADPAQPWLPATDDSPPSGVPADGHESCGAYICLPANVATVDDQSGQVKAGNGQYPRTYAIAMLSVDDEAATFPLVFEPRSSFQQPAPPPPVPVAVPAPPPPPAAAPPTTPSVNLPAAPVLPVLTAQALAPPPVPPSPPTFASQAPLDLNINPAALDVSAPSAVTQPPTPPVNPAPPSGARREARQRQAAAQKSGADSGEEQVQDEGVDLAAQPPSADGSSSMSRNEFRALAHREQPSAWARDALLGGGLGLAALLLALGANTARPTPRRREPELPAPAFARSTDRRRR